MKNKKIFLSLLLLFISSFFVFAQASVTALTIAPEIGFTNGKIIENVWYVDVAQTQKAITYTPTTRESRLVWQFKNSFFFGINTGLVINDSLDFSFGIKSSFRHQCGNMEDFDWIDTTDPDKLSKYSIHDNYLEMFYNLDFCFGWIFYLTQSKSISLIPRLGLEIQNISFSGEDGWRTYESENWKIKQFTGTVITYEQTFAAPVLALKADFNFAEHFEALLDFSAVWINTLNCIDVHKIRGALFNDRIQNAWKFECEPAFFYKINKNHKVGIKGNISYIPDAYGFTYTSKTATKPDLGNPPAIGGTSRFLWSYNLVYVFTL